MSKQGMKRKQYKGYKEVTAAKMHASRKRTAETLKWRERNKILRDKPKLRGWLHLITFPLCVAASIVLICLTPNGSEKVAVSIYAATVMLLFGTSAALHIGHGYWPKKVDDVLVRIDYSNIFLVIAGTNTPFLFAIEPRLCWPYFGVIWGAAIIGTVVHLIWAEGLDWLFSIIYIVLGLAPVTLLKVFWDTPVIGPIPTILIIVGGACYIIGAVFFAIRKPNPVPKWFGYHELFHLGTVAGYVCHLIAIFMMICALR